MRLASRSLVIVLLALVTARTAIVHAEISPVTPASHDRSAGCHEHGHKSPAPGPKSYVCCLAGHDSAILQPSSVLSPALHSAVVVYVAEPASPTTRLRGREYSVISSGDPPGVTSLRI